MNRYGLLGEKLSHSYSPIIHKKIFEYLNIEASYDLLEVKADELPLMIEKLKNGEFKGFNVTIPYKKEVMKYLDKISDEALAIGSVNTIVYEDGKAIGYNTDYYGFYNELLYYNVPVKNKDCYVLGTGGASLAIHKALVDLGGNVLYVSRNPSNCGTIGYDELALRKIDLLVNTTPVGMYPNVDAMACDKEVVNKASYVVDIIFNPRKTKLLENSKTGFNGLLMLVGQAVKAEELWQKQEIKIDYEKLMKEI